MRLPVYKRIFKSGYELAIWNCGSGFKDLRITIREYSLNGSGEWRFTIKKGDYEDEKRCSIYFKPFGINLSSFFEYLKRIRIEKSEQNVER